MSLKNQTLKQLTFDKINKLNSPITVKAIKCVIEKLLKKNLQAQMANSSKHLRKK